jgi:hypothetical protein
MVAELTLPIAVAALLATLCSSNRGAVVGLVTLAAVSAGVDHYLPIEWSRNVTGSRWYEIPDLGIPDGSAVILVNGIGYTQRAMPRNTTIIGLGTNYFFAGIPTDGGTLAVLDHIHQALWRRPEQVFDVSLSTLPLAFDRQHVEGAFGFAPRAVDCKAHDTNLGILTVCHLVPVHHGAAPDRLTAR